MSSCDDFLNLLVRTRSTAAMFRAMDQAQREDAKVFGQGGGEDAMVAKWMHSCKLQSTESGESKQRKSVTGGSTSSAAAGRTTKTSECTVVMDSSDQRHLVLVVPHCLELILGPCASSELKATAASVVRLVTPSVSYYSTAPPNLVIYADMWTWRASRGVCRISTRRTSDCVRATSSWRGM